MKKLKLITVLLLISVSFQGFSQKKNKDSLFTVWSDTTNLPKARVNAFYYRFHPFERVELTPEVLRWEKGSEKLQELAIEAELNDYLPYLKLLEAGKFILLNDLETACTSAKEAFYLAVEQHDYETIKESYEIIRDQCDLSEDTTIDETLVELWQKITDPHLKITFTESITFYLYRQSRFSEALPLCQTVIDYYNTHKMQPDDVLAFTLMNVGNIHKHLQNFEEAKPYYRRSKFVFGLLNDEINRMKIDLNLAETFALEKSIDSAQVHIKEVFDYYSNVPECVPCLGRAYAIEAQIMNLRHDYEKTIKSLESLASRFDETGSKSDDDIKYSGSFNIESYHFTLAEAYLGLKQHKKAIETAKKGINLNIRSSYIIKNYDVLYRAQRAAGQYKNALETHIRYNKMNDSIAQLRNSQEVLRRELGFQFEKQRLADSLNVEQKRLENELNLQTEINKQKNTKNILLALGAAAILIAIGLWYRLKYIRKTQKIIQQEKDKAQASERAKHQFLANMSHEIRTPMNAIKGMTDILLRRKPRKDQTEYLDGIKQSSDSLLVIINDILDISKIEAGKIELEQLPFSVNEIVKNVQTIMQFKAEEKGLQLKTNLPLEKIIVKGDATRLRQILINLISNAIKFTDKGIITTTVTSEKIEGKLRLHFTVSDTGIGIDQDRIEKIFESFEQAYSDTSRKFGGTGLGLSISKKLVELHQGKIWVESEKGKGSQFHFTILYELPKTIANSKENTITAESNAAEHLKGVKILLVEDNHFNAVVAQEELEDAIENVIIEVAENGAIAVEKVKSSHFDVILMDVQMPVMNGYEATQKIRTLNNGKSNIPIIAMTANVLKEEVDKCYEAGMDDFIEKPFNTKELLQKIHKLTKKQ